MVPVVDAIGRLLIIFLLSLSIGLERQIRRKPVGFGTFTFVASGSCILALLALDLVEANPLPLLGGVITGIGFLGAGALIRHQDRVFGFTTAALIWAMAAMGIATGTGHFEMTITLYMLVWAVIVVDRQLEARGWGSHAKVLRLTLANPVPLGEMGSYFPGKESHLERVEFDKDQGVVRMTAQVRIRPEEVEALLQSLQANEKVRGVEME